MSGHIFPNIADAHYSIRVHHIESVHFTSSNGEALHPAIAVVQTPWREYYILKDNGMQIGCEEDGIPIVWMQLLGCNSVGHADAVE